MEETYMIIFIVIMITLLLVLLNILLYACSIRDSDGIFMSGGAITVVLIFGLLIGLITPLKKTTSLIEPDHIIKDSSVVIYIVNSITLMEKSKDIVREPQNYQIQKTNYFNLFNMRAPEEEPTYKIVRKKQ
jgi:hypothetical protein